MRKVMIAAFAVAAVAAGPFAAAAQANETVCKVMEKVGYDWVKECE